MFFYSDIQTISCELGALHSLPKWDLFKIKMNKGFAITAKTGRFTNDVPSDSFRSFGYKKSLHKTYSLCIFTYTGLLLFLRAFRST